jgi:hypothetical protein
VNAEYLEWNGSIHLKNNLIEIIKEFLRIFPGKKSFLFLHFLTQNIWWNGKKVVPLYQIKEIKHIV